MDAVKDFLKYLEGRFEEEREPIDPIYPYDKETNTISLPPKLNKKLKRLVLKGKKVEAVKQVTQLTGAGLRLSARRMSRPERTNEVCEVQGRLHPRDGLREARPEHG